MTGDPPFDTSFDPEGLRAFISELEAEGFTRVAAWDWQGPTRPSLLEGGHTDSETMRLIVRPSWPYLPPLLNVPGITAWHADRENLCIWQEEDNSQRWVTLQGLYDRIDEWAANATDGFAQIENARNPEIYWQDEIPRAGGLIDIEGLLGGDRADGQHGEFHFTDAVSTDGGVSPNVFDLHPGGFSPMTNLPSQVPAQLEDGTPGHRLVRGRWFYRSSLPHPPRGLVEFRESLTENQRRRLDKDLRDRPLLMFGLFWPNEAGLVGTVLIASKNSKNERDFGLVVLRPKGREAMLLRAGPDAEILQSKYVAILGVGAIGSHVADQLGRAGLGRIRLVDYDDLWPANLIRHAAPPETPAGTLKTTAVKHHLVHRPWIEVEEPAEMSERVVWTRDAIEPILESADLTIDATGHAGLAELIGRVANSVDRPVVSVALFRGGQVARVRRQARPDDTPIAQRSGLDRYPKIPPLDEEAEYVGTEVGCLSPVHNAPPVSVVQAAALASGMAIDHLTGRHDQPDEIIEVLRPGEAPFNHLGRVRREDLPYVVDVSEAAHDLLRTASKEALPNETGGVLLGCEIDERPVVAEVVEIHDAEATPRAYNIPEGCVEEVVTEAQTRDPRIGYLGEWHSHPSSGGPSALDLATMSLRTQDSGLVNPVLILVDAAHSEVGGYVATGAGLRPAQICLTGGLPADRLADAS